MGQSIRKLFKRLRQLEDALLVTLLMTMILVAVAQVVMRNVVGGGLYWGDSLVRVTVLWVALVGGMVASRNDSHINIDLANRFLSEAIRPWVERATHLFACVVLICFAWGSAQFVRYEFLDDAVAFADVPAWLCEIIMPIGGGVMAIRYALLTVFPRSLYPSLYATDTAHDDDESGQRSTL